MERTDPKAVAGQLPTRGGLRGLWIALAIGLNLAPLLWMDRRGSGLTARQFLVPAAAPGRTLATEAQLPESKTNAVPALREELVDPGFSLPSSHVASLCELAGGRLAAAWYAGTREGARDVAVYFATREPGEGGQWSAPRPIVTHETAAQETFRYVKKVGNAVLFGGTDGPLYLLYVSIAVGGWSGSSLNFKQSFDDGHTWSASQRLGLSPFFNASELVKNGPVPLGDGGWAVPIYHELFGKFPELLWLHPRPRGVTAVKSRAYGGRTGFQPALVALDSQRALLLCRTASQDHDLLLARTADAGRNWTRPENSGLPNSDSGLDAVRLADGRILLAFNDTPADRHNLRLALSDDEGSTWRRGGVVADERGVEFSYPFLLQTSDGWVHLAYTWKRRGIRHVTFNLAWLDRPVLDPRP